MKPLIILPTYNERENIEGLVFEILKHHPNFDILIIDDNSPDGTGEVAEGITREDNRVKILHRPKKLGLGSAYVEGFKFALKNEYDLVFEMDADQSHQPRYISDFIDLSTKYDVVIGSRYINGISVVHWPLKRLIVSLMANWFARVVTKLKIKDITSGFVSYRRNVLEKIDIKKESHANNYVFQVEMKYRAFCNGFRLKEIPIIFVERRKGSSKMDFKVIWEAFWRILALRILRLKK